MANGMPTTVHAQVGPSTMPVTAPNERVEHRRDLASWWKNVKRSDKKSAQPVVSQGIFGVPLQTSIRYANVAISLFDDEGRSYIYGYVPIVVAKCGVFLKEKATDVEGIFRLAGSEKRIKELKVAFDSPDRYGKGLDWTGFTVHDAANILRRYFNQLPEPIIPLDFYQRFRDPLRNHKAAQTPNSSGFDHEGAIGSYQALITELPPLNRQLLLYILDLLAVFASKSDLNKMTTANLAAIFQPGILSHPQHDMAPAEYRLSQDILIFLIENQDSFLIGMQGTAADAETVRDVQSGASPAISSHPNTPPRFKTALARSASNASAGAESVRKWGQIRRNVSVSSKHSQQSQVGPTPVVASFSNPGTPTTSGVYRSNTVPSRRTTTSPRFLRDKSSGPSTPSGNSITPTEVEVPFADSSAQVTPTATKATLANATTSTASAPSSEAIIPLAVPATTQASPPTTQTPKRETVPQLKTWGNPPESLAEKPTSAISATASHGGFLNIFNRSPTSDGDARKPNKLQKRRAPGSSLSSAHSSSHSLGHEHEGVARAPSNPVQHPDPIAETLVEHTSPQAQSIHVPSTPHRSTTDATIRPNPSPTHSYHSHTDLSDADLVGDDMPAQGTDKSDREKKRNRWRFSRSQNKQEIPSTPGSSNPLGMMSPREHTTSFSTVGSSQPRKSFQEQSLAGTSDNDVGPSVLHPHNADAVFSDSERERKGPMSWIRGKLQDRKESKEAERRARTPERRAVDVRKFSETEIAPARLSEDPERQQGTIQSEGTHTVGPSPAKSLVIETAPPQSAGDSDAAATPTMPMSHAPSGVNTKEHAGA